MIGCVLAVGITAGCGGVDNSLSQPGVAGGQSADASGSGGIGALGAGSSGAGAGGEAVAGTAAGSAAAGGAAAGGAAAGGAGSEVGGASACNSLVQVAPFITPTDAVGSAPAATQGRIAAGTYTLTEETYYPGGLPHTAAEVAATVSVVVAGSVATLNFVLGDGSRYTLAITMATPPTGSPTREELICTTNPSATGAPGNVTGVVTYSAAPDKLVSYVPLVNVLTVYTLQP